MNNDFPLKINIVPFTDSSNAEFTGLIEKKLQFFHIFDELSSLMLLSAKCVE